MRTRTSNKAAIAAAVVASLHSLGDGGAVVSAFVVPTGGRAHLASEASSSRMMFSLQEVADVGRRLASGGGTVAVGGGGGGTKAKSTAAVAKKQQQQVPKAKVKPAPVVKKTPVYNPLAKKPAPVVKKTPVYNPLAGKRSEIVAAKNKKKTPFAPFGAGKSASSKKLAAAPVKKKAVAAAKPFKNASAAGAVGASSFSDLIADFQSKDEAEQRKLIGASVAALLVGGAALGGGGSSPAPPTPKPAPRPKPSAKSKPVPAPVPAVKEVVEVKAVEEPTSQAEPKREPIPEVISPPPAPIIVETPPAPAPAPATKPKVYESKVGKESFSSKLLEPIGGPSTPSPAPVRVMRPAPPALTKEPWFKKSMNAYLEENAAEGDLASNAPLIAAGLLGLIATRSTMESSKEMREQKQDAMDILEAAGGGELDEADILIQQLDAKIAFFKDDDDLRKALEVVRDDLLVLQAKKKSLDA